jgi:hypothetical protein
MSDPNELTDDEIELISKHIPPRYAILLAEPLRALLRAASSPECGRVGELDPHDALRYMACRESAVERGLFATPEEYDAMVDDSLRKKGKEVLTGRGNNYGKNVAKDGSLYRPPAQPAQDERAAFEAHLRSIKYPLLPIWHNGVPSDHVLRDMFAGWHARASSPALSGEAREVLAEIRDALDGIRRYGSDTLSGRTDGPDDRDWQRQAVNEMTKRARVAIERIDRGSEK